MKFAERLEDGVILRGAFFAMLAGTLGMLYVDYRELPNYTDQVVSQPDFAPILPAIDRPEIDPDNPAYKPQERITTDQSVLSQPLEIEMLSNGILRLEGTITPGISAAFATELDRLAEYVEVISINSPGGSVTDALAMGRLIRAADLPTAVAPGEFCASSCPLVFSGGIQRIASAASVIGVHQVYTSEDNGISAAQALSDAQITTAEVTRYLKEMGVDPALWLHALDTPPDKLYYLTPQELTDLNLATKIEG